RVNAIDLSYIWPRRTGQIDGVTVSQTRSDVTGDGRVNAIDLSTTWPKRGPSMQDVLDPVLPPSSTGADLSQGALDAAAALWIARQEDTSPAPPDSATQPTDISLPLPAADVLLSGVSGSQEPADVLAVPAEGGAETATPSPANPDLDPDLLDVLGVTALAGPLVK
ncbi:MAG: dockerin type I domain-containing protein, partial [Phycisphaerae bacterium]